MAEEKRLVIGLIEDVKIKGSKAVKALKAKIDTGASRSSICQSVLKEIGSTPTLKKVTVRTAMSREVRPLIKLKIRLDRHWINSTFTVTKRTDMRYKVLLGENTLKKLGVMIDPKIK